jgi:hypothetical protein
MKKMKSSAFVLTLLLGASLSAATAPPTIGGSNSTGVKETPCAAETVSPGSRSPKPNVQVQKPGLRPKASASRPQQRGPCTPRGSRPATGG